MFIVFYSYKGGVGRTLALANVACNMAGDKDHPQKVLLWDFDLEAPGLHKLFPLKSPFEFGFVDLTFEYAQKGKLPRVSDYIVQSKIAGIDILPAGKVDSVYCDKLQLINWPGFFSSDPSDQGHFFNELKDQIRALDYDYVLIDSRTGLNDQAGICTQVLPDLLVMLFRLNSQNLDGLEHLVPTIRSQLSLRHKADVDVLPVASAVVSSSRKEYQEYRTRIGDIFDTRELHYIRFDADLVTEEKLFSFDAEKKDVWPIPPIVEDYKRLTALLRGKNPSDTRVASDLVQNKIHVGDYVSASNILMSLIKRRPHLPQLWEYLKEILDHHVIEPEAIDRIVKLMGNSAEPNPYVFEWNGMRQLQEAHDIEDNSVEQLKLLGLAESSLQAAIDAGGEQSRLLRTLAYIASCKSDLETVVKALRKARLLDSENNQLILDLARTYFRMGANYYPSALEELNQISPDFYFDTMSKTIDYINSFFGIDPPPDALEEADDEELSGDFEEVFLAHRLLAAGKKREALEIGRRLLSSQVKPNSDFANLAEFFVCAEEFQDAINLIDRASESRSPKKYSAIRILAEYLVGSHHEHPISFVLNAWKDIELWDYRELLLFRERVIRDNKDPTYDSPLIDKLRVIEKLVAQAELLHSAYLGHIPFFGRRMFGAKSRQRALRTRTRRKRDS